MHTHINITSTTTFLIITWTVHLGAQVVIVITDSQPDRRSRA